MNCLTTGVVNAAYSTVPYWYRLKFISVNNINYGTVLVDDSLSNTKKLSVWNQKKIYILLAHRRYLITWYMMWNTPVYLPIYMI